MSTIVFPAGGRRLVDRMCAKFPDLYVNEDEKQRELTRRINQQFRFTFGPRWGGKVRAGLDPIVNASKDSQAYREDDGRVSTWDMFQGNAAVTILVDDGKPPDHPDLPTSEARFIDYPPKDWLEGAGEEPEEPTDPTLAPRVAALEGQVAELSEANAGLKAQLTELQARVADGFVALSARIEMNTIELAKPLIVRGRSAPAGTSFLRHSHQVDLVVSRE